MCRTIGNRSSPPTRHGGTSPSVVAEKRWGGVGCCAKLKPSDEWEGELWRPVIWWGLGLHTQRGVDLVWSELKGLGNFKNTHFNKIDMGMG